MKKFKLFSFASFIKGRKSNGYGDYSDSYKYFMAERVNSVQSVD